MNKSKVIIPLVATTILGLVAANLKSSGKSAKTLCDIDKFTTSDSTANEPEKTFGGLKQAVINEIVANTSRAVKAVVMNGDTLKLFYESASGKNRYETDYTLDATGKLTGQIVSGFSTANTPHIFADNVTKAMKQANQE